MKSKSLVAHGDGAILWADDSHIPSTPQMANVNLGISKLNFVLASKAEAPTRLELFTVSMEIIP